MRHWILLFSSTVKIAKSQRRTASTVCWRSSFESWRQSCRKSQRKIWTVRKQKLVLGTIVRLRFPDEHPWCSSTISLKGSFLRTWRCSKQWILQRNQGYYEVRQYKRCDIRNEENAVSKVETKAGTLFSYVPYGLQPERKAVRWGRLQIWMKGSKPTANKHPLWRTRTTKRYASGNRNGQKHGGRLATQCSPNHITSFS